MVLGGVKKRERWEEIFGLEASHVSLPGPSIKLARARWAGPSPRLANEDHWKSRPRYIPLGRTRTAARHWFS